MINEIVDDYKTYLTVKYPSHLDPFNSRFKNSPESARAEAVLFSILRANFKSVSLAEDINSGGPDFFCKTEETQFLLEVRSLKADTLENQSGIKSKIPENASGQWFSMITDVLRTTASDKAMQVSGFPMPRILAITTEHLAGDFLLGSHAAELMLTSDSKIAVPINQPKEKTHLVTELKDSVFFRWEDSNIKPCRQSISAILLIDIQYDKCIIHGILHPEPAYNLPIKLFPSVPFVRLKKWPIENNTLETEWVIHRPQGSTIHFQRISLTDAELRGNDS